MWGSSLAFETVVVKPWGWWKTKMKESVILNVLIIATFILIVMPQLTTCASSVTDWLYIVMLYTVKYNATMPNKICIRVPCLCMHNLCEWWNHRQLQSPVICIYVYKNMQRLPNLKWKSEFNLTIFNVPTGMTLPYWKKSKSKASISHFTSLSTHSCQNSKCKSVNWFL